MQRHLVILWSLVQLLILGLRLVLLLAQCHGLAEYVRVLRLMMTLITTFWPVARAGADQISSALVWTLLRDFAGGGVLRTHFPRTIDLFFDPIGTRAHLFFGTLFVEEHLILNLLPSFVLLVALAWPTKL